MKKSIPLLYKFRNEPLIAYGTGLAPRNYMPKSYFAKIKNMRIEEIGESKCELCKKKASDGNRIEFHESYEINENVFRILGLHLLCVRCHQSVHDGMVFPGRYRRNKTETNKQHFLWAYRDDIKVDYSYMKKYGVDSDSLEKKFYESDKYSHARTYRIMARAFLQTDFSEDRFWFEKPKPIAWSISRIKSLNDDALDFALFKIKKDDEMMAAAKEFTVIDKELSKKCYNWWRRESSDHFAEIIRKHKNLI